MKITLRALLYRAIIILALLFNYVSSLQPQGVQAAALIRVNSTIDRLSNDGLCTLREAVISANKDAPSGSKRGECDPGSGADTIQIQAGLGEIVLTRTDNGKEDASATGDLDIIAPVTIEALGPGLVVRGSDGFTDRIFHILGGSLNLSDITIRGGAVKGDGGAIYNNATLIIQGSTITSNTATGDGGGIYNAAAGTLTLTNSTLSGNSSQGSGGGLFNAGNAALNNVTITSNTANSNSDLLGKGGGVAAPGGVLTVLNSIVAGNSDSSPAGSAPDCSGAVTGGYSLFGSTSGCTFSGDAGSNLNGISPLLGPLQDNGGYTPTHALLDGSPAIDSANPSMPASSPSACSTVDQRGVFRPHGFACDMGAYEAGKPNSSVLIRAFSASASSSGGMTTAVGRLTSAPNLTFSLQFYTASVCNPSEGGATAVGSPISVTTNGAGTAYFNATISASISYGQYLWAVTQDPGGFLSDPSGCVRVGAGNDSWPNALRLDPQSSIDYRVSVDEFIDLPGGSRWYKFQGQPNSKLFLALTGLPANYDLTLYKDISQAYRSIQSTQDLLLLGAEFAPEAFSPEAFSPEAFSPEAFSPEAFSPEAFSPEAFSPEAFSPDAFSPEAFSPEAFSPEAFSPEAFSPEAFSPEAFSSAQSHSLIAVSAFDGLVGEGLLVNTWDNAGDFYVRVRGRNGAYDPNQAFHLEIRQIPGACSTLNTVFPASTTTPDAGDYHTLVLTNLDVMQGTSEEKAALLDRLDVFISRTEVQGKVIDLAQDARFTQAFAQASQPQFAACPYAMNLAAGTAKEIVDAYWDLNPDLEYLVIIGNDSVIPFFRHADHALLGSEKGYVPPVRDNTSSQASLKLGYVLSQDDYGARINVSLKDDAFPIPDLAVGRLVETAAEASTMLDAYLMTPAGVVETPDSALVTGYDFLEDVAIRVRGEFQQGLGDGSVVDELISPRDFSPAHQDAWTADMLRAALLEDRHDLVFLAGHFSASGALAADYTTRLKTSDLVSSSVDLTNSLVYSVGCHAGYNIVNGHNVPGVTFEPDWAQAFARKGATLIAGTGYQYGDTDFIRYSEELYLNFTQELRYGSGPVSVGEALVRAKQAYLAGTPFLRGIDEKSLLEATLFGLPMLSIDLPLAGRLDRTGDPSVVLSTSPFPEDPGETFGLEYYDLDLQPELTPIPVSLRNVQDTSQVSQTLYYSGTHGIVSNPNEPVLPLSQYNVSVTGKVLRGVGFRSGTYQDLANVLTFTGAATTEIRGVHAPFNSNYFFPVQTWRLNNFPALQGGDARLSLFPVQYRSTDPASATSTQRKYDSLGLRLFYSQDFGYYQANGIASASALQAAAPTIAQISSRIEGDDLRFLVRVVGDPAAGIQEAWITFTGESGPLYGAWQSLDLDQNLRDTTLWEAVLPLGGLDPASIRYIVQASNGMGLVAANTNHGAYFIPGFETSQGVATELAIVNNPDGAIPASGRYTEKVTFSARLTSEGSPLAGVPLAFILGPQSRLATTDSDGRATVTLSIYGLPGDTQLRVLFAGNPAYQASFATRDFTAHRQFTEISLNPSPVSGYPEDAPLLTATLTDVTGRRLGEETLFFVVKGDGDPYYEAVITDYAGRAPLGPLPLPPGDYSVDVYFNGQVPLSETITLVDDRYEPASLLDASLTLINRVPAALDDLYTLDEDGSLSIAAPGVLANDSDPEGAPLSAVLASGPSNGTLDLAPDGSFSYAPLANFNGSDSFTYRASDGRDASLATVSIQVNAINDAPQAVPDTYTTQEDIPLVIPAPGVLGNDLDIDGDPLSASLVSVPLSGSLTLNLDGSFTYLPLDGFSGTVSFDYQVSDGSLASAPVTVQIDVTPVNDPPVCTEAMTSPDSLWPPDNNFISVSLINLTDPDGDPLSVTIDRVFQDEPVGKNADAILRGGSVDLRAERDGNGNGRVYHLYFTVTDGMGGTCNGEKVIGVVAHDQSGDVLPIDGGPLYDSTLP